MSLRAKIKRYLLIIEKTSQSGFYPAKGEIQEFIEEQGIKCSSRTFDRDIQDLREEFDINIVYDSVKRGYHFEKDKSTKPDEFIQILSAAVTAETFLEGLKDYKSLTDFIHVSSSNTTMKGIHQLDTLLDATKNSRVIEFDHLNFWTGNIKRYILEPYLLKEYQNRWYVVGFVPSEKKVRTFGIDRIDNLQVQTKNFKRNPKLDIKSKFEDVVGLTYDINKMEKVVLEFTEFQGKYIETQPIHHSQAIENVGDKYMVTYYLIPNHEFMQRIMMYGAEVKVLEPQWLVDRVREEFEKGVAIYG